MDRASTSRTSALRERERIFVLSPSSRNSSEAKPAATEEGGAEGEGNKDDDSAERGRMLVAIKAVLKERKKTSNKIHIGIEE